MKIYNLILLNFYFLQNFSLLFGMHPGEGPSGSQPRVIHQGKGSGTQQPVEEDEFTQLNVQIFPLLENVGDMPPHPNIAVRPLSSSGFVEQITNVRKQYDNLVYAYGELLADSVEFNQQLNNNLIARNLPQNNHNITQELNRRINDCHSVLAYNKAQQNGVIADMQTLYAYVNHLHGFNQAIQNEDQHGQGQPDQSHRGRGRGRRGRRGGNRGAGPGN